jgi:cytoskeletal protein CcmA (bactofilin family)
VIVRGKVESNIRANTLRLEKTFKVKGNIFQESPTVGSGSHIESNFIHSDEPMNTSTVKSSEKVISSKSIISSARNENIFY